MGEGEKAPISSGRGHEVTEAGQNLNVAHDKVRNAHPIAT